jgi:hypothetical protein
MDAREEAQMEGYVDLYNGRETATQRLERNRWERRAGIWRELGQALKGDIHGWQPIYVTLRKVDGIGGEDETYQVINITVDNSTE